MPSTPAWRCLSTPAPGHEPCEADTPRQSPLLCHGALSPSPCFWAPPSARDPWLLCSAPSQPFRSLPCTPLLPGEEEKRKQRSSPRAWILPWALTSTTSLPGSQDPCQPQPPRSVPYLGLHPCRRRPPSAPRGPRHPQGAPACPVWNTRPCPPTQGPHSCPSRLPSGSAGRSAAPQPGVWGPPERAPGSSPPSAPWLSGDSTGRGPSSSWGVLLARGGGFRGQARWVWPEVSGHRECVSSARPQLVGMAALGRPDRAELTEPQAGPLGRRAPPEETRRPQRSQSSREEQTAARPPPGALSPALELGRGSSGGSR